MKKINSSWYDELDEDEQYYVDRVREYEDSFYDLDEEEQSYILEELNCENWDQIVHKAMRHPEEICDKLEAAFEDCDVEITSSRKPIKSSNT